MYRYLEYNHDRKIKALQNNLSFYVFTFMIQISYNCIPKSSIKRFSPNCISTSGLSLDSRERRESESYAEGVRLPVVYLSLVVKIVQVMQIYQKF